MTSANLISLVPGYKRQEHFLKRRVPVVNFGLHFDLDERYVRSVVDRSGNGTSKIGRRTWKQGGDGDSRNMLRPNSSDTYSQRDHRSMLDCQDMSEMRYDATFATKEVMRDTSNPSNTTCKKSREFGDTSKGDRDVC